VPGVQGIGVVERSATLRPGTRVWFATSAGMAPGDGSLADYGAVPEADLVAVVAPVPDPAVAALGLSAVAAWMALTWRARLKPGERVLVLGAGGAVGQAAVGAARHSDPATSPPCAGRPRRRSTPERPERTRSSSWVVMSMS
jgi:NADPH:quinone reductase-like Zn-dependent oxidoreductase